VAVIYEMRRDIEDEVALLAILQAGCFRLLEKPPVWQVAQEAEWNASVQV
jgi:hypothetical protein